ncbi:exo-alpha-sialidase [Sphingobacterium sp. UT-1RO-CII-1]|uniref:sialidase family protein n=1 Tax=Sphingobacterium sp. UT-1RO-CII-1 TaxID=2995225 RepID=UPI00227CCEAB|nr:sialidase family protein [Sphingobacterium sp. UT-1RO-CII-1]MCY4779419.1 exo-alpha-sialidase [Sphingobacterium sp. UT-1RO-CII-1]
MNKPIMNTLFFLCALFFASSCNSKAENSQFKMVDSSDVFKDGEYFAEAHASTLVRLDNGEVLASWFGGTKEGNDDVGIWLARKTNGNNWSKSIQIAKIRDDAHWNPVLFVDNSKQVHLFFKVGKKIPTWETWLMSSTDGGHTWSEPVELVEGDRGGRGPVRNKPIILSNGNWIAGASTEEGAWIPFVDISKDDGQSWQRSADINFDTVEVKGKGMIQPTLWESTPGKVHMLLRTTSGFIYRSDSEDNGQTWSEAYSIGLPNPNSGIDLVKMKNGDLALLYNPDSKDWGSRGELRLALSKDNGSTWKDVFTLESGDPKDEYSYPAIISWDNTLGMTYTFNRKTIVFRELTISK